MKRGWVLGSLWLVVIGLLLFSTGALAAVNQSRTYSVPVLVLTYIPIMADGSVNTSSTGDWHDADITHLRQHISALNAQLIAMLGKGTAYHVYKDSAATPSLRYVINDSKEFLKPVPTIPGIGSRPADHFRILKQEGFDICDYVENHGVKEVWLWMYHTNLAYPVESYQLGPYSGVGNGYMNLPLCAKTYTVYDYNYGRGLAEAIEDHTHHYEAMYRYVDYSLWSQFVGPWGNYASYRCGWTHCPPNTLLDCHFPPMVHNYDWANRTVVLSDCEDWKPTGGALNNVSCLTWDAQCDGDSGDNFKVWWMQNIPGKDNNLSTSSGGKLRNWWDFVGDYDAAMLTGAWLADPMTCGNGLIDDGESCEPPDTPNSDKCPQNTTVCNLTTKQLGTRQAYGSCEANCTCRSSPYIFSCSAGKCGAQASSEADCPVGYLFNQSGCKCIEFIPAQPPCPSIVGLWHFDGSAADYSGKGNNGVIKDGAVCNSTGKFSKACSFTSRQNAVSIPNSASLQLRENFTIMLWFNSRQPINNSFYPSLLSKGHNFSESSYYLAFNGFYGPAGRGPIMVSLRKENGGGTLGATSTRQSWKPNEWHHVAFTYERIIGRDSIIKLYIDGLLDSTSSAGYDAGRIRATNDPLIIGNSFADNGISFNGLIDEVRIYNKPFNASLIKATYNLSLTRFTACSMQTLDRVLVTPANITIPPGQTVQFKAVALDTAGNAILTPITWSALTGSITQGGLFTAGNATGTVINGVKAYASFNGVAKAGYAGTNVFCAAGWKCLGSDKWGYQSGSCSWSGIVECNNGCGNDGCLHTTCNESDGYNLSTRGFAVLSKFTNNSLKSTANFTEDCSNQSVVREMQCSNGNLLTEEVQCPTWTKCVEGACVKSCVPGYYCTGDGEWGYVNASCVYVTKFSCNSGCDANGCSSSSCYDKDDGINLTVKSSATGELFRNGSRTDIVTYNDRCNGTIIWEAVCEENMVNMYSFDCPSGTNCTDGACTSADPCLTADVNHDGKVNIIDLTAIRNHYSAAASYAEAYDLNRDGAVDSRDYSMAQTYFGLTCNPACTDTDGGRNYGLKGSVYLGQQLSGTDYCVSASQLVEFFCSGDTPTAEWVNCSCSDGACVELQDKYFYSQELNVFNMFGQLNYTEASEKTVTAGKIFHAAGVVVDISSQPNVIYTADPGNNRILGFASLGICRSNSSPCTNDLDCGGSTCFIDGYKKADLVIGQPDSMHGACNLDSNFGFYHNASAQTLCLQGFPDETNVGEAWSRLNNDVDSEGNLYVLDRWNNRVLIYKQPLSLDKSAGKGDAVADFTIGQPSLTANSINQGLGRDARNSSTLYLSFGGTAYDHVSSRGVSVDPTGNVWVADTFNGRILRFPPGSVTADLELGQASFTTKDRTYCPGWSYLNPASIPTFPKSLMCTPTLAKVNPENGELYVIDTYRGFYSRILVFTPPFSSGMSASRVIFPTEGPTTGDPYVFRVTGLEFNTYRQGNYSSGTIWVSDDLGAQRRVLLLNSTGGILKVIGAINTTHTGCDYGIYGRCGQDVFNNFSLCWPGSSPAIDNANNIYLADESFHRIAIFKLPYDTYTVGGNNCLPNATGGIFKGNTANSQSDYKWGGGVGAYTFQNQLFVRDNGRYLVWNNYTSKPVGSSADFVITEQTLGQRAYHAVDDKGRLWTVNGHTQIIVYQLPFTEGAQPLANFVKLYWADTGLQLDYSSGERGLAFDPISKKLWISDRHRLLRISNYDNLTGRLYVDMVLGQPDKNHNACNWNQSEPWIAGGRPNAQTLCSPYMVRFDNFGNMYVVENGYECHGNNRITVFMASDLANATGLFPNMAAKKVFVSSTLTQYPSCGAHFTARWRTGEPESPVSIAFNSHNQMVVGNDGYYKYSNIQERPRKQLWLYNDPLKKSPDGSFVQGQLPDYAINVPLGAPGELSFDSQDNLIIQDHTWPRVWVINFDKDPSWLVAAR